MMTNRWAPKKWVLLRYHTHNNSTFDRLLVSIQPKYAGDEGWRLSEELKSTKDKGHEISFRTHDGEIYNCKHEGEGMSLLTASVLPEIKYEASVIHGASIEIIDFAGENK